MSDQFDKKLVNRINDVFDNYEDDSANEGWMKLREHLPEKSNRRVAVWWMSAAAAVLLICGIGFIFNQQTDNEDKIAKTNLPEIKSPSPGNDLEIAKVPNKPTEQNIENNSAASQPEKSAQKQLSSIKINGGSSFKSKFTNEDTVEEQFTEPAEIQSDRLKENSEHDLTLMALASKQSPKADTSASLTIAAIEKTTQTNQQQTYNQPNKTNLNSEIYSSNTNTKPISSDKDDLKKRNKTDKNITLGFFAGSYFNYADGSQTSINSGVGLSSEIKISKKLKISTGISLGQNSLKYEQAIPQTAAMSFSSSGDIAYMDHQKNNSPALIASSPSYTINSYDAKLLGFDIPVNLKYTLLEKKNTFYISTGFSSNFFIDESYTYTFDYQTNRNSMLNISNQESSAQSNSFDFARVLNFSIGIDHPLNNQTKISFEPFVKYPLSGLGAHDLKFGAAGINLKLNFNRLK